MKTTFFIITITILIIGCSSNKPNTGLSNNVYPKESDTLRIANDSLAYEIIIIEPGFQSWLTTQPPRGFYAQSTLEISNNFKVIEYNLRVNNPMRYDPDLYQWRINYDRTVDYGFEVNYLLYHWFLFFEKRYNQRL